MRGLISIPHFYKEAIEDCIAMGPNYNNKYYEDTIRREENQTTYEENRYEVLEYWGVLDAKLAREVGMEIPEDLSELDQVQVNIWVSGMHILRCVLNPFTPSRIPYQVIPYEINPYQLWGVGVAENMEDAQMLMNGHVRMAIDNLTLAGNLVFDVDEASLVPDKTWTSFLERYLEDSQV